MRSVLAVRHERAEHHVVDHGLVVSVREAHGDHRSAWVEADRTRQVAPPRWDAERRNVQAVREAGRANSARYGRELERRHVEPIG